MNLVWLLVNLEERKRAHGLPLLFRLFELLAVDLVLLVFIGKATYCRQDDVGRVKEVMYYRRQSRNTYEIPYIHIADPSLPLYP